MPVQRRFDFQLAGKGFMLSRNASTGRAWDRTGKPDTPGQRSAESIKYGAVSDMLDHPEVFNDWSGGFGYGYKELGANTYHWAENFDARFPKQLIHCQAPQKLPARYATCNDFVHRIFNVPTPTAQGAEPFPGTGGILLQRKDRHARLDPTGLLVSGSAFDFQVYSWGSLNIIGPAAVFGSHVYMGVSEATGFARRDLNAADATMGPIPGRGFVVAGNRLWRYHGNQSRDIYLQNVAAGADAMATANWSATITIGDGFTSIHDMTSVGDQVFAGMPNGLYAGDSSGTFVNVLGELRSNVHYDNFRDLTVFDGTVVAPYIGGILRYWPNALVALVEHVSPQSMGGNRSPMRGRFRCVTNHGGWLYAGNYTNSASYILAGRPGPNGWTWHTQQRLPDWSKISRLHIDQVTTPSGGAVDIPNRFWVATDASIDTGGTCPLYYFPIPRRNDNPLADPSFTPNYIGSARMDMGVVDWNAPGTPKIFRDVEVWSDKLVSGALWCQVYYDVDMSGSFTLLGTVAKSPVDTLYFPSGEGSFVTGQSIELSLRSFTASSAFTPIYRSLVLRGALQPRSIDIITAVVRIADNVRDRQDNEMRSAATMLQELRDFGNPDAQGLQAHQLIDLSGATQWVKVLGRIDEHEVYQAGTDNPEIAATVRMAVLTYS